MRQADQAKLATRPGRRIIERPRLLKLLDETEARTILLIAPAGYGKTTLARQWQRRAGGAWLGLTPSARDMPVLGRALGQALSELAPLALGRIEKVIRVARTPTDQAHAIAQIVLECVPARSDNWLCVDDWHVVGGSEAASQLLVGLDRSGPIRMLLASRTRPSWITARDLLYEDVIELGMTELALNDSEVAAILETEAVPAALRQQTHGWPAAIALVAHSATPKTPLKAESSQLSLYEYLADELYESAPLSAREELLKVALTPPLPREALVELLGTAVALDELLATGLVHEADGQIEVHPLARSFLFMKVRARADARELAGAATKFATSRGYWDEAFELIREFEVLAYLESLITVAYASLIETGRITTLGAYGDYAARHGHVNHHLLDLIEAETALRDGNLARAESLGKDAADGLASDHPLKGRGYFVAGTAAQLNHSLESAFDLHTRAMHLAKTPHAVSDAAWGRCLAALYLEGPRLKAALSEFESLSHTRPEDRLRIFIARQHRARLLEGLYDVSTERALAEQLLEGIDDPWVRTGWGNTLGYTLMLQAHYAEARSVIVEALRDAEAWALAFGRPHLEWSLSSAELGLRHFSSADSLLRRVERYAAQTGDPHLVLNCRALRARLLLAQHRLEDALTVVGPEFRSFPTPAMYAEYLSTRALALAVIGEKAAALATATRALGLTEAVETRILCSAVSAVTAIQTSDSSDEVEALLAAASRLKTWDGVVCAMRAYPMLLAIAAKCPEYQAQLSDLTGRSNDSALAKSVGLDQQRRYGAVGVLSPREQEVLDLFRQGMKNNDIATALYISPATVKVHVRHILEKLGARTRAEAVSRYAEIATGTGDTPGQSP